MPYPGVIYGKVYCKNVSYLISFQGHTRDFDREMLKNGKILMTWL